MGRILEMRHGGKMGIGLGTTHFAERVPVWDPRVRDAIRGKWQIAGASVENQTPTHTDIGDTVLYGAKGAKAGFRESVVTDQEHHAQIGNEGPPGTF